MQHERNYNDEQLARLTGMRRLDIDPTRVEMGWIIDFCAQALRNIIIGIGGRFDGFTMQSKFGIAVGSECMAILAVIRDLADLKERLNNITVAFDKSGKPVTTGDLEVGNAMTAFMRNTINPTMMCTAEYNPCLVHAGPFANIAVGQSSIIADRVGLKLFDYHVTESGFGADIGFEKFWNVKCRFSGLKPHVSVLTTTIRALKMHGGGPKVVTGKALPDEYTKENLELVEKGCANMVITSTPSARPASTRWSASTASIPIPTPSAPSCARPPRRPAPAAPSPSTGNWAAKAPWNSPMRSSTPVTKKTTSNSSIRWR
jgi:formate--tetrahydrofolate ligase